MSRSSGKLRRAFSLVEVVMATFIMGMLLVAAMKTVGNSARADRSNSDECIGFRLAHQLMSEIVAADYVEPDESPTFGPEATENGGSRSAFDDVDDYHNWSATPPETDDGTLIPDRTDWDRSVAVEYVDPNDLTATVGTDQGVKRITVTIQRDGQSVAQMTAIRTDTDEGE